jgi:hypothetical protein
MNSQSRRWRSGWALALAMALLLPALYVLSIGPAVPILEATGPNYQIEEAARMFYFPVIWLHENTPLEEPLEQYVEFWEDLV